MTAIRPLIVPQVNVNDESVRLVQWLVEPGADVRVGDVVCLVETTKAVTEIVADAAGVFRPIVLPDDMVMIGAPLGYVGESLGAVDRELAKRAAASAAQVPSAGTRATARARALAETHGVDLAEVAAAGAVTGTIKETDVERFMAARFSRVPTAGIPPALAGSLAAPADLSRHELGIIDSLRRTKDELILTTLDFDVPLGVIAPRLQEAQRKGVMLSFQHLAIAALGRTLRQFPRLMSFRSGSQVLTYLSVDVAFVVRSQDGRLFTPVVRAADTLTPADVARACGAAAMRVNRGRVTPAELEAACFTVSHIPDRGVSRFVALPNRFQSAVLAIPAVAGGAVTCTLSYDHALCDGSYAAAFMGAWAASLEGLAA